jgi:hypothetical protein
MELIEINKLINTLKEKGIDLGKGNPYNRLRYYTKIGWLPHMTRKKNEKGEIAGHYPKEVIEQIIKIEGFKKSGINNEEITKELKKSKINKTSNALSLIKRININIIFVLIILIGIFLEFYKFTSLEEKTIPVTEKLNIEVIAENEIKDSGIGYISKNSKIVFTPTSKVNSKSIILLNFFDNIGYNNSFYIKEVKENQGFFIELNYPVNQESKFNWVIIE